MRYIHQFKKNMYEKYLPNHITGRFPSSFYIPLYGLGIFDPLRLSQDLSLHATHGFDLLQVLKDHYGPHNTRRNLFSPWAQRRLEAIVTLRNVTRFSVHILLSWQAVFCRECAGIKCLCYSKCKRATYANCAGAAST